MAEENEAKLFIVEEAESDLPITQMQCKQSDEARLQAH